MQEKDFYTEGAVNFAFKITVHRRSSNTSYAHTMTSHIKLHPSSKLSPVINSYGKISLKPYKSPLPQKKTIPFLCFYPPSAMHARIAALLALIPIKMNIFLPAFLRPAELPT